MKNWAAVALLFLILISTTSCTPTEKPVEDNSSEIVLSSNSIPEEFVGFGKKSWNLIYTNTNYGENILYYYDEYQSIWAFDTVARSNECIWNMDEHPRAAITDLNVLGNAVYGLVKHTQVIPDTSAVTGYRVEENTDYPSFVNIRGNENFQPVILESKNVRFPILANGSIYFWGELGLYQTTIETGETLLLVESDYLRYVLYDETYIYYQDEPTGNEANLLYRFPYAFPDQVEVFDMGFEAIPKFILNGEIYLQNGTAKKLTTSYSKVVWGGVAESVFPELSIIELEPYGDQFVVSTGTLQSGRENISIYDSDGSLIEILVTTGEEDVVTASFTSFGDTFVYTENALASGVNQYVPPTRVFMTATGEKILVSEP